MAGIEVCDDSSFPCGPDVVPGSITAGISVMVLSNVSARGGP